MYTRKGSIRRYNYAACGFVMRAAGFQDRSWWTSILRLPLLILALSSCGLAQSTPGVEPPNATAVDKSAKQQPQQPKLTSQQEQGLRLLKAAEAEAAGPDPAMRAFVLWRASYAYALIDPKKAESLAKDSFVATESIEDVAGDDQCGPIGGAGDIKAWIQERVLSEMIRKQKIAEAEDLLTQATNPVRNHITRELITHYVQTVKNIHLTRPPPCCWQWARSNRLIE